MLGSDPETIVDRTRIEVTGPAETVAAAIAFFRGAADAGHCPVAIGIGSFGPVELRRDHPDYGSITRTPKANWSGTPLVEPVAAALGVPVGFDTDVNAAVLGEGRWGAARDVASFIYLTVGTGIGGGAVMDGRVIHGLGHPEMGHVAVPRRTGDGFAGVCPFHGDCLEGMASGPAIAARFGRPAESLQGRDRDEARALTAFYLAAGIRSLVYALSPECVVIGGGLGSMEGLVEATRSALGGQLGGYPGLPEHRTATFIRAAGLGSMAGPAGTLLLAEEAARAAGAAGRS